MAQRVAAAEIAMQTGPCEWTSEGNRKAALLPYVRRRGALREQGRRMTVRTEWAHGFASSRVVPQDHFFLSQQSAGAGFCFFGGNDDVYFIEAMAARAAGTMDWIRRMKQVKKLI